MTGIQILNELLGQLETTQGKIAVWTLSEAAYSELLKMRCNDGGPLTFSVKDGFRISGVPAHLWLDQEREIIPWRDEAMMRKETGIA